jgi:LacI family transcriptional regulator
LANINLFGDQDISVMIKITIKDLAKMLKVSPSTISRALKDHPDIGQELKTRIKNLAKELNYSPNSMAVNFRKGKSKLIGVILPKFYRNFIPDVIDGISFVVDENQYQMIILPTNDLLSKEKDAIQKCCDYCVDGILLALSNETVDLGHLKILDDLEIPVVLFDKSIETDGYTQVLIDDRLMAERCAQKMEQKSISKVAAFLGHENLTISKRRKDGFQSGILNEHTQVHYVHATSSAEAKEKALTLMEQGVSGFFGMSDEVLVGILAAAKAQNKINETYVIGFSDGKTIPFLHEEIDYVHHDGKEIGETAARLLFDLIKSPEKISKVIQVNTEIVRGKLEWPKK